jgi:hypothetical protein
MSQQYVYDIKLSTGIAPKSLDPEGFPLVETKYIETAEGHRLSDKLTAIDNQLLVNDQKIDTESIKLQNKIDANKDEVDGEISAINEHLTQTDTNLAQEVTDRVSFGHAINNELLKVNTRIDGIDAAIETTKVECKTYTDNKVSEQALAIQRDLANEADTRQVQDAALQEQIDNKVNFVNYKADKDVTDDAIRSINNTLNSIPNTYATKAEVSGVENTIQGKIDLKLNKAQFDVFESVVDGKFTDIDTEVGSLQQEVTGIKQDYLKSSDKAELENSINSKLSEGTFNSYKEQTNSNVQSLSNSITTLNNTVMSNKEEFEEKTSKKANSSDVYTKTEIDETVNSLQETVNNISSELDGTVKTAIKEEADRAIEAESALDDKIDTKVDSTIYQNKIEEITTDILLKANKQDVEASIGTLNANKLDKETYNTEKTQFALKSEIPTLDHLATKAEVENDVEAIRSITDTLGQNIDNIELELNSKVSNEDLSSTVSQIDSKITQAQTNAVNIVTSNLAPSIEANTDALNEKADKSSLSEYVKKADIDAKQDVIVFAGDIQTGTTIGGIPAGTNLKGRSLKEILIQMFGVSVPVTGLSLDKNTLTLSLNSSSTLTAQVQPADATNSTVNWVVEGDGATISSNEGHTITVTAGSTAGSAIITATCAEFTASCNVTVEGEIAAIQEILNNNIPAITGTSTDDASEVNWQVIDNATDTTDKTLQGFYTYKSGDDITAAGYQLTVPSATTVEGQVVYVPAVATVKNVYTWDDELNKSWTNVLDWSELWVKQSDITTVNNIEYIIYKYNPEFDGTYLIGPSYWRFEIEL